MRRLAWYGPTDRYQAAPGGGMCLSVFAVAKHRGKCLLGVPNRDDRWMTEWIPAWRSYSKEDHEDVFNQRRLPSGYLREGEHPDDCLRRVVREQIGVREFTASPPKVLSYATPSEWYPGNEHWDIVFAYDVKLHQPVKVLPWWSKLGFMGKAELADAKFGWNDDLMRDLGII